METELEQLQKRISAMESHLSNVRLILSCLFSESLMPITSIRGFADVLLKIDNQNLSETQINDIELIKVAGDRLFRFRQCQMDFAGFGIVIPDSAQIYDLADLWHILTDLFDEIPHGSKQRRFEKIVDQASLDVIANQKIFVDSRAIKTVIDNTIEGMTDCFQVEQTRIEFRVNEQYLEIIIKPLNSPAKRRADLSEYQDYLAKSFFYLNDELVSKPILKLYDGAFSYIMEEEDHFERAIISLPIVEMEGADGN